MGPARATVSAFTILAPLSVRARRARAQTQAARERLPYLAPAKTTALRLPGGAIAPTRFDASVDTTFVVAKAGGDNPASSAARFFPLPLREASPAAGAGAWSGHSAVNVSSSKCAPIILPHGT